MLVLVVAQDVHTGKGSSLLAADPIGASTPQCPTVPISKSARGCSLYVSSLRSTSAGGDHRQISGETLVNRAILRRFMDFAPPPPRSRVQ
jgi:hypothetical protein